MFRKKPSTPRFEELATDAVDQALESLERTGLRGETAAAINDTLLTGYLGCNVDWKTVWANAAGRDRSTPEIFGSDIYPTSSAGVSTTTVLSFGSTPYWTADIREKDGMAPVSLLAFLGRSRRYSVASDRQTSPETLDLIRQDPDRVIANTATTTVRAKVSDRYRLSRDSNRFWSNPSW